GAIRCLLPVFAGRGDIGANTCFEDRLDGFVGEDLAAYRHDPAGQTRYQRVGPRVDRDNHALRLDVPGGGRYRRSALGRCDFRHVCLADARAMTLRGGGQPGEVTTGVKQPTVRREDAAGDLFTQWRPDDILHIFAIEQLRREAVLMQERDIRALAIEVGLGQSEGHDARHPEIAVDLLATDDVLCQCPPVCGYGPDRACGVPAKRVDRAAVGEGTAAGEEAAIAAGRAPADDLA